MNAIKFLETQHEEVSGLLEKAEKSKNAKARQKLFQKIGDALAVHATIEEKIFYPAVMAKKTEDILLEAAEEHLSIKRVIADLMQLEGDDRTYHAKISVLMEDVEHHVKEERTSLFPAVRKLMDKAELEELGVRLEMMTKELEQQDQPRDAVPGETGHAAELPEV
jgi:hemerythrin superfamily protein